MDASPVLAKIVKVFHNCRLEAVLIGNAAAALQGAPVTTLDFDFMFRDTPVNRRKLKAVARALRLTVWQPFQPAPDVFRLQSDDLSLQLDFIASPKAIRSFAGFADSRGHMA